MRRLSMVSSVIFVGSTGALLVGGMSAAWADETVCRVYQRHVATGDVNIDGRVDVADTVQIGNMTHGRQAAHVVNILQGDLNGNGRLDGGDAARLREHLFLGRALPTYLRGDANGDGRVELSDTVAIGMWVNQRDGQINVYAADYNCDTRVDMADVAALLHALYIGRP